jgi:hypothetical protein
LSYGVASRDYLSRAKILRSADGFSSLFYAAFEIRCGIEARMSEYLDAQKHISDKKKKGWKIAELARNIEDAFRLGEKKAIIRIIDGQTHEHVLSASYTPVRKRARIIAEKLGNYMHHAKKYYDDSDQHWINFRKLVDEGISELEFSTSGTLLGPPIFNPKTGEGLLSLEGSEDKLEYMQRMPQVLIKVDYV